MPTSPVGDILRRWRAHRGLSQLDLAATAAVSQRHLSFVETGRSRPSAELLSHLARHLTMPLRAHNDLLLAAGYAPAHTAHRLDTGEMAPVRDALAQLLAHHEPYPAVVVDRAYDVVDANAGALQLLALVAPALAPTTDGLNLIELTLDENGLGGACTNLAEVAIAMQTRLERDRLLHPDDERIAELWARSAAAAGPPEAPPAVATPVRLRTPAGDLALFSVLATVGSAADVTAEELSVELFYPMDDDTRRAFVDLAGNVADGD